VRVSAFMVQVSQFSIAYEATPHGPIALMSSAYGRSFAVRASPVMYVPRCGERRGVQFHEAQRSAKADTECTPANARVCSLPDIQYCGARAGDALVRSAESAVHYHGHDILCLHGASPLWFSV